MTVSRTVWISSLLLRVGITGVALALWAVVSGATAQTSFAVALFSAAAGAAIAVLALRKAWRMLAAEEVGAAPAPAPAPQRARTAALSPFPRVAH